MRLRLDRRSAALAAMLAAAVTLVAGLVSVANRSTTYEATSAVLITPPAGDTTLSVTGSDTLSRGTIVATYAQAYASSRIGQLAYQAAGLGPASTAEVSVSTRVVSGTSIIRITASSPDQATSEKAADALASYHPQLAGYSVAFLPSVIETAAGHGAATGPSTPLLLVMILALAAGAGAAVWIGMGRLAAMMTRRRGTRPSEPLASAARPEPDATEEPSESRYPEAAGDQEGSTVSNGGGRRETRGIVG